MALRTKDETEITIHYLSDDEACELFDEIAMRELGMGGEEFLRRWDAGEYATGPEDERVVHVAMSISLVR